MNKKQQVFDNEENLRRLGSHQKAADEEQFLNNLNDNLTDLELELESSTAQNNDFQPPIFIFGLPRSGTTLLYQLLAFSLKTSYVDNLSARFWKTPLVGLKLSSIIHRDAKQSSNFKSSFGLTENVTEPHEFGYFWADIFNYSENNIKTGNELNSIDWTNVKNKVEILSKFSANPFIHKNLIYALHLGDFYEAFNNSLFIYIKRNPIDTALSILNSRLARYGDRNSWWSIRPTEYDKLKSYSWSDQIANQMKILESIFDEGFEKISSENRVTVEYSDLCKNPAAVLSEVIASYTGSLELDQEPPLSFEEKQYSPEKSGDDYIQMKRSLDGV